MPRGERRLAAGQGRILRPRAGRTKRDAREYELRTGAHLDPRPLRHARPQPRFLGCATGTLVGKQCYMPPEQVKGKAQPASDIFAMGATLYFLLTGHDPQALTTSKPRSKVSEVSEDLDQLIRRMTQLELSERNIDAKGVLAEVERIAKVHGHFISLETSIDARAR